MADIKSFVNEIYDSFNTDNEVLEEDQLLPEREALNEVCSLLLNVSCMREEGRFPHFRVCFIPIDSDYVKVYIYAHVFKFDNPIELTIHELYKLAPALNNKVDQLIIDVRKKPYTIVGMLMAHSTSNSTYSSHGAKNKMPLIPNILIKDVAELDFCFGEKPVVHYHAGRCHHYRVDVLEATPVAKKLREGSLIPKDDQLKVLYGMMKKIDSYGHGGHLIIVSQDSDYEDLIDSKYKLPIHFIPEDGICANIDSSVIHEKAISAYIEMVARLSCVDGGVVLNKNLELIGFGVEIVLDLKSLEEPQMRFISSDGRIDTSYHFSDNGMRHRACYRFCDAVEDSIAIIFSQDGGTKVCTKHEGIVYVYNDVAAPIM